MRKSPFYSYKLLTSFIVSSNSFPSKQVKMSSKDPSLMSSLLKHLLSKRNKLLREGIVHEAGFFQPRITELMKENQLNLTMVNK